MLHLSLMAIFPRSLKPPSEGFAILVGKKETDLSQQKRILSIDTSPQLQVYQTDLQQKGETNAHTSIGSLASRTVKI